MREEIERILGEPSLAVDGTGTPTSYRLQAATAAVLVYAAKSDGKLSENDLTSLMHGLAKQFKLPDDETSELIDVADFLHRDQKKLAELAALVKRSFEKPQRIAILALLLKVLHADGAVGFGEKIMGEQTAYMLDLETEDVIQARELVEKGKV